MEEIYLKGFNRREWCSDQVELKPYFDSYYNALPQWPDKKKLEVEILKYYAPEANHFTAEELATLADITNGAQLTALCNDDYKQIALGSKAAKRGPSNREEGPEGFDILKKTISTEKRRKKNRIKNDRTQYLRKDITLDSAEKCGFRDLIPRQQFIVSFRIHEPFNHNIGNNARPGRCMQEVEVLCDQTLTALKEKIVCESDFQDTRGDISVCPQLLTTKFARDYYRSSMFYIDDTFYVDLGHTSNIDYSVSIKQWAQERGMKLGPTLSMGEITVRNLKLRFGYPYVYIHQGCCEHLVVINDARLLSAKDTLYSSDYPLIRKITFNNLKYCMTCGRLPAQWIIRDCDRLVHDPAYQCKDCFKMFHYINGKKIGNFKAFKYWQRSVLM